MMIRGAHAATAAAFFASAALPGAKFLQIMPAAAVFEACLVFLLLVSAIVPDAAAACRCLLMNKMLSMPKKS
jgi:hypothetical protein